MCPVKALEQNSDAIVRALRPREYGNVDTPKPEDYCLAQLSYQSLAHTLTESAPQNLYSAPRKNAKIPYGGKCREESG